MAVKFVKIDEMKKNLTRLNTKQFLKLRKEEQSGALQFLEELSKFCRRTVFKLVQAVNSDHTVCPRKTWLPLMSRVNDARSDLNVLIPYKEPILCYFWQNKFD